VSEYFEEDEPQGLPAGVYPATLVAIEDVTVEPFKDPKSGTDNGERWGFDWDVETDDGVVRLRQLTSRKLNDFPTNAWKVLSAFGYRGGRALRSDFIGKRCQLTLGLKANGWNTFDAVSPERPTLNLRADMPQMSQAAREFPEDDVEIAEAS
jgi:hypothetical protein